MSLVIYNKKLVSEKQRRDITRGTTLIADIISHFTHPTIRLPITGKTDIPY